MRSYESFSTPNSIRNYNAIIISIALIFAITTLICRFILFDFVPVTFSDIPKEFNGYVLDHPRHRENSTQFTVAIKSDEFHDSVRISITSRPISVGKGDRVILSGSIKSTIQDYAISHTGFDYNQYLARQGIGYTMLYPQITVTQKNHSVVRRLRDWYIDKIDTLLSEPYSSLVLGMVIGEKSRLDIELQEKFRSTGVSHILVVSGFNISLVIACVLGILFFLSQRIQAIVAIGIVIFYILIVGFDAPVMRAGIMGIVGLSAIITRRSHAALRSLFIACYAIIMYEPRMIFDISFYLSVTATLGILTLGSWMVHRLKFLTKPIAGAVGVCVGAFVGVCPLIIYMSGSLSPMSIVVNIIITPLVPIITILGASLFLPIGYIDQITAFILNVLNTVLVYIVTYSQSYVEKYSIQMDFDVSDILFAYMTIFASIMLIYAIFQSGCRSREPRIHSDFPRNSN